MVGLYLQGSSHSNPSNDNSSRRETKFSLQEKSLEKIKVTEGKTIVVGQKMDLVFHTLQLGIFFMDFDLISKGIDKAKRYAILC
jgi:hypothetical protein